MTTPLNKVGDLQVEPAAARYCLRLWVAGRHGLERTADGIARMAAQLGVADAAHFLEGFMVALNRGATRRIEIGCLRCPCIGPDEQMLLDALAFTQERRLFEAVLLLQPAFGAESIRTALLNAEGLGRALARIGRFLPAPTNDTGEPDVTTWFMTAEP